MENTITNQGNMGDLPSNFSGKNLLDKGNLGVVGDLGRANYQQERKGRGGAIIFFIFIYLLSAGVLAYGAYQYGLYKGGGGLGQRDGGVLTTDYGLQTIVAPTLTMDTVTPTTDYRLQPTPLRQGSAGQAVTVRPSPSTSLKVNPTLTPTPTPTPTISNLINYKYQLPSGWQVVQASDASFEMGFEPNKYMADVGGSLGYVGIVPKDGGSYISLINLRPYNGGSRHQFIFGTQPITKGDVPEDYREKEFTFEGKGCLFLEGLHISMSPTVWGMCDAGGGKAFWINTWSTDYIQVVRSLRRLR